MGRVTGTTAVREWRCCCPHACLLGLILGGLTVQLRLRQRIYLISGHGTHIEAICPRCGALSCLSLPYTLMEA